MFPQPAVAALGEGEGKDSSAAGNGRAMSDANLDGKAGGGDDSGGDDPGADSDGSHGSDVVGTGRSRRRNSLQQRRTPATSARAACRALRDAKCAARKFIKHWCGSRRLGSAQCASARAAVDSELLCPRMPQAAPLLRLFVKQVEAAPARKEQARQARHGQRLQAGQAAQHSNASAPAVVSTSKRLKGVLDGYVPCVVRHAGVIHPACCAPVCWFDLAGVRRTDKYVNAVVATGFLLDHAFSDEAVTHCCLPADTDAVEAALAAVKSVVDRLAASEQAMDVDAGEAYSPKPMFAVLCQH